MDINKTGGTVFAESTALEGAFSENEKRCRLGKSKQGIVHTL